MKSKISKMFSNPPRVEIKKNRLLTLIILIGFLPLMVNAQPPWTYTSTGDNHTIIIPGTANLTFLDGSSLPVGSYIGVFYDAGGGILECGGYVEWAGSGTSLAAWEDSVTGPAKNGFENGETFKYKIWLPNGLILDYVLATYEPIGFAGGLVTATDTYGTDEISMIASLTGIFSRFLVQGNIFEDIDASCSKDTSDMDIPGMYVKAEPGPYYGLTNNVGNYNLFLPDTGSYSISVVIQDSLREATCNTSYNVHLSGPSDTIAGINFSLKANYYCPRLTVELGTPLLRRCFNNTYTVSYGNTGTLPATNAYIEIDFGDSLVPQSSTIPWSGISGNVYTFPIGDIGINQHGSFTVRALLSCNTTLGSTQCVSAHIYPDTICIPPDTTWDGSSIKVKARCASNDTLEFSIENTGSDMTGDSLEYFIVEDIVMLRNEKFKLASGQIKKLYELANGSTFRLEAQQSTGHPGKSMPAVTVEGCGTDSTGNISLGFVTTLPQDDANPFISIDCQEIIGSIDPNDKTGYPKGVGANKLIAAETELEYKIRFQNTGTDTAFKVVVRDTLSEYLDIATVELGSASHNYDFRIFGSGVLEWTFNNILLPDSNTNEPASHGFVNFKVAQIDSNVDGTVIKNSADIYFDYNTPVKTNTEFNTVGDVYEELGLDRCDQQSIPLNKGWNIISSYIQPDNPDMLAVFHEIITDILLIKNNAGQSVIPSFGINSIGNWNSTEGYVVKTTNSATLVMECEIIDPATTPIPLATGWSIISYLRSSPMNIASALNDIQNSILVVKDYAGTTYIPSFGINQIGNMQPGQGYKIKMSNAATLTYPDNAKTSRALNFVKPQQPVHYILKENTGNNATIIVPVESIAGLVTGDEIGVFGKYGKLTGAAVYEGKHLAINVWGDDATTKEEIEGMVEGQDFDFRIWRNAEQKELTAEVEYEEGNKTYINDGITILKALILTGESGDKNFFINCYPNPSSGITYFDLFLIEKSDVVLKIYDVTGKLVNKQEAKEVSGKYQLTFASDMLPKGRYNYAIVVNGDSNSGSFIKIQ